MALLKSGTRVFGTLNVNTAIFVGNTTSSLNIVPYIDRAFAQANISLVQANAAFIIANLALIRANAAFAQSNIALTQANAAFITANGAFAQSNIALTQANAAFAQSNIALTQANAAFAQANIALTQANAAFAQSNIALTQANAAFDQANSAYSYASILYSIPIYYDLDDVSYLTNGIRTTFPLAYEQSNYFPSSEFVIVLEVNGKTLQAFANTYDVTWQSSVLAINKGFKLNSDGQTQVEVQLVTPPPPASDVVIRVFTQQLLDPVYLPSVKRYPFKPLDVLMGY